MRDSMARQSYLLVQYDCSSATVAVGTPCDHDEEEEREIPGGRRAVETRSFMKDRRVSGMDIWKGVCLAIVKVLVLFLRLTCRQNLTSDFNREKTSSRDEVTIE